MQEAAEILALGVVPDAEFPAARQVLAPLVLEGVVDAGAWAPMELKRSPATLQCRPYEVPLSEDTAGTH